MSEQTRQLAERIARDLFTSEKGERATQLSLVTLVTYLGRLDEAAAADCIEKHLAEAAGASVPQEAALEQLMIARREYLDADKRGEVESIDELSPATYKLLMAAIAPVVPPTAEDIAWAKGELKELGLTGEASSAPQGEPSSTEDSQLPASNP